MPDLTRLLSCIQTEFDLAQNFLALLDSEKVELESRNLEALQQILPKKADLLTAIEVEHLKRREWQQAAAIDVGDKALGEYLQAEQDSCAKDCSLLLEKLNDCLAICNKNNMLNGLIIANSKRRNSTQLEILRGQPQSKTLYNAKGSALANNPMSKRVQEA